MHVRAALLSLTLLRPAASAPSITAKLLFQAHTPSAWFGSSAIGVQGPSDPVFMASTWVYPPTEVVGYRPAKNATFPVWKEDTTKDLHYQTLYVASPGVPPRAPGGVDALAFWNLKPHGLDGTCALFGFNSAVGPDLRLNSDSSPPPPRPRGGT